jgi:RNA recognition motif-containing protein
MKSKHDKSNGSNSDRESNGKYDSKNVVSNDIDDSMSDGGDRSRSGSVNRNDRSSKGIYFKIYLKLVFKIKTYIIDKVDHDALSIYIGNVDYSATEEELRNTFISCGEIVRVTIIKNMKTGHPKGAAFIEFTDKEGVQAAMQLNGKEVKGKSINI